LEDLRRSILSLNEWIQNNNFKAYEPFDGLSSYFFPLTFGKKLPMRILQQLVLRSPFHIRPLLGIRPLDSTKGRGFFAKGYLHLWQATGEEKYKKLAAACLDWLIKNISPGYSGACWGNHFNYASRGGIILKGTPTIVWTSLIGHTFFDAYKLTENKRYLEIAKSACHFIMEDIPKKDYPDGTSCLSYVPNEMREIHNSNMLGASLLARYCSYQNDERILNLSDCSMKYSLKRQLPDGSWYYGEAKKYHWIDNWHTAYNLDSLKWFEDTIGTGKYVKNLNKGFSFYKKNFFLDDGTPKYFSNETYPIDIQAASQAIDTLSFFSNYDPEAIQLARKVTNWTIHNMQDSSGYFYYRKLKWKIVRIPMIHWGQATMLSALAHFYKKLETFKTHNKR
jgi:hypothetical protein